ncbi:hypothetical protein e1116g03.tmp0101 [Eimeria tenella]|uniref:Uncharacterized protein n=1 Tax=Eimeria tenella TaxID=5802 RepID=C8TE43_EIMTE|nr:hypothetical protein e1116g03.tmp0101 [Eimeria tenella]
MYLKWSEEASCRRITFNKILYPLLMALRDKHHQINIIRQTLAQWQRAGTVHQLERTITAFHRNHSIQYETHQCTSNKVSARIKLQVCWPSTIRMAT